MKKSLVLGVTVLGAGLLLTGCGAAKNEKLVCKQSQSNVNVTFNINFENSKINAMDFSYDMDLSNFSDTQIAAIEKQDLCTSVKNAMSAYKDAFLDCGQKVDNKKMIVSAELDVKKISESVFNQKTSVSDVEKAVEAQGFTCEVE